MERFAPTFGIKDTSKNIKQFIRENNSEVWKIFKPFIPFIVGLHLFDALIGGIFPKSTGAFVLGGILASYFYTCLAISWHRVVIKGVDNYTPVNPFKPKKHELIFLGMGVVIGVFIFVVLGVTFGLAIAMESLVMGLIATGIVVAAIYVSYRVVFYFPAKAIDANITLHESFDMTKGYLWKLISASFLASIKWLPPMIFYSFVVRVISLIYIEESGLDAGFYIMTLVLSLPVLLYFQVFLTVIGVTAISNYYLYALQNPKGE
jgi:hypothetical protein